MARLMSANAIALAVMSLVCGTAGNAEVSPEVPEDVTAAGFPFPAGRYALSDDCNASELTFGIVDFAADHSHEFEADGAARFVKILKIGEGHYRITEEWPDMDSDENYTIEADYIATGEGRFQRLATDGDETLTEDYLYCGADTVVGRL